jgi:hypothetical protein
VPRHEFCHVIISTGLQHDSPFHLDSLHLLSSCILVDASRHATRLEVHACADTLDFCCCECKAVPKRERGQGPGLHELKRAQCACLGHTSRAMEDIILPPKSKKKTAVVFCRKLERPKIALGGVRLGELRRREYRELTVE